MSVYRMNPMKELGMKRSFKPTKMALAGLVGYAVLAVSGAQAHHSFSIYDLDNPIELTGTLESLRFRNPHTLLVLEVPTEDGAETEEVTVSWLIESMNPGRWDRLIDTRDIAVEGETVTIKGWPAVNGGPTMALGTITSPSKGKKVIREEILQDTRGSRNRSGGMGR